MPPGKDVSSRFTTVGVGSQNFAYIEPRIAPSAPVVGASVGMSPEQASARIKEIESEARRALYASTGDSKHLTSIRIPFSDLPKEKADELTAELELLRGMRGPGGALQEYGVRLNKSLERAALTQTTANGSIEIDLLGKIARGEDITANDLWFAVTSVGHQMRDVRRDATGAATEALANVYNVSRTHYSEEYLQHMADLINQNKTGGLENYVVLDIEQPGLDPAEGLTEVAARRFQRGAEEAKVSFKLPNNAMRTGVRNLNGETATVEQFMMATTPGVEIGRGDESFLELLREIEKANYNVVGHNVEFDINNLIYHLKRTAAYKVPDSEFRRLVDTWELNAGKSIDTRVLAGAAFHDVGIAPEITARATFTPSSLENILLETDYLEYLSSRGILEDRAIDELMEARMHTADVDTALESSMHEYFMDVMHGRYKPRYRTQADIDAGVAPVVRESWRSRAVGGAVGPRIPASSIDELVGPLRAHPGIMSLFQPTPDTFIPPTPQQQAMLLNRLQRPMGVTVNQDMSIADSVIQYRLANRFFTDASLLQGPGLAAPPATWGEWLTLQRQLMEAGVPYAHLHYLERQATSVLGQAYRHLPGGGALSRHLQFAESIGDYMPQTMAYLSGVSVFPSGNVSLPLELVEKGLGREVTHLSLSVFELQKQETQGMLDLAFNVGLSDEDITALSKYIGETDLRHLGVDAETAGKIIRGLTEKRKVQVASLGQGVGSSEVDLTARRLKNIIGKITDTSAGQKSPLAIILPRKASRRTVAATDMRGRPGELLAMGQVVSQNVADVPEFLDEEVSIATQMQEHFARLRSTVSRDVLSTIPAPSGFQPDILPSTATVADQAEAAAQKLAVTLSRKELREKALARYGQIKKFGAIGAGVAAIGLTGYYFYQRAKKNAKLDETMARQEYEDTYSNAFRPTAPEYDRGNLIIPQQATQAAQEFNPIANQGESRRYEYMRTAGVVRRQDRRRIGHTRMGNDRYNHLFGGR